MKKYLILLLSLSIFASGLHGQCNFNNNSISPENYSSALGTENTSTGLSSFAAGSLNVSDDMYSTSLGYHNTASGQVSFAAGGYVSATGTYSIGIGDYLEAAGTSSIVIGTGAGTTNRLVNYNQSSLMIGFGSNKPTFFVGTAASSTKTGKIGIGDMTNPQAKLHIKTDLGELNALRLEPWSWTGDNYAEIQFGDADNAIRGTYNSGLGFYTPNNYIFHTGNVGIGKTPTEKLDVNGNIRQTENCYIGTDKVQAVGENGLSLYNYNQQGILISPGGNVAIGTGSALHKLTVNGNIFASSNAYIAGNTGIGTVTPQEKLHVEGNQYLSGNLTVHGSSNLNGIVLNNDTDISGADEIIGYNDLRLKGDGNGGTDVTITADGKVGVGTGAPTEKLEVTGKVKASGFILTTNPGEGKLLQSDASGNATWASPAWAFNNGNFYCTTGKVVVGDEQTLTPEGYSLFVENGILTEKIKCAAKNGYWWSDFVFDEDYKLLPIKELKGYIKENGRLPDIPSSEQVKTEGIELVEMNALLLLKIEELSLYIIQLNDEIEKLKK